MSPFQSLREQLGARPVPPRPWLDDACDWADPEFSRQFAITGSLGSGRARQEAAFLAEQLPAGGRALDLGCGAGRTARALCRLGFPVLGVDLGPGAIELARERTELSGCCFRVGDMTTDDYPEGPFELAYCIDCGLAGMPPELARTCLERVRGALVPGGRLVLEFPSLAMAEGLDLRQDWYLDQESPAGCFPQLVLTEDFFHREDSVYTHRAYALDLESGEVRGYSQSYQVYSLEAATDLLDRAGFSLLDCHGEVGAGAYAEEESERLVLVASRGDGSPG